MNPGGQIPVKTPRVHILRDGHMLRGSDYGTVYAVSVVTEGFRLPDRALNAILEYARKFDPKKEVSP